MTYVIVRQILNLNDLMAYMARTSLIYLISHIHTGSDIPKTFTVLPVRTVLYYGNRVCEILLRQLRYCRQHCTSNDAVMPASLVHAWLYKCTNAYPVNVPCWYFFKRARQKYLTIVLWLTFLNHERAFDRFSGLYRPSLERLLWFSKFGCATLTWWDHRSARF